MSSEESDEPDVSSHGVHRPVADNNTPSHIDQLTHAQIPNWTFPPTSSRNSPSSSVAEASISSSASNPLTTIFSQRSTPRHPVTATSELDATGPLPSIQQPSVFTNPNRSLFSSGPPTSSLSANTALASLSAPSVANPGRPLSALTIPSSSSSRRSVHYQIDAPVVSRKNRVPRREKDVDDPSVGGEEPTRSAERRGVSTPTALTRLFTTPETSTPAVSRHASYTRTLSGATYTRVSSTETAPLPSHLYSRGLLNGKHSDIAVHAFGIRYALHRLLLDRAPFFASALSEPWFESSSKEIDLHPDDIDSNITQTAFELALKRLYGCNVATEEDKEAIGLFATGCWLEMADLIESSVTSIMRQMSPTKLASLIRLVTNNYYGQPGDRILASAKAMLCREGWEMPLRYWDGISGEIVREIIGGDGFFIPGEWERWVLAKRILDRRLKLLATEAGLIEANGRHLRAPPDTMNFLAIRFDTVYRKNSIASSRPIPEAYDPWLALYTSPDVAALLVLLDEGIHYIHLSFEQLQRIRNQRDVLGLPVLPEKVISNALWMSMELRQKVVSANDLDMELGLSYTSEELVEEHDTNSADAGASVNINAEASTGKCKQVDSNVHQNEEDEMESGSWDGNGKPRKFWIPHTDSTSIMGGTSDAIVAADGSARPYTTRHLARLSATIDPQDVQWASDFTASVKDRPAAPGRTISSEAATPISYTHFPPFRFSAEFPNPRNLKEKKRVYSRTVWYAGSLWNVYIQKVETSKNTQLGVYLHRAKEKEDRNRSVDERIGHVEMLMRRNERNRRQVQPDHRVEADEDTSGSGGDPDATLVTDPTPAPSRATALSSLLRGDGIMKASQTPGTLSLSNLPDRAYNATTMGSEDDNDDAAGDAGKKIRNPTMPLYIDARPTIKTYFKIYSPSKGGRMLSVYESAPDHFNFSQSWGWKSSTMILDDGLLGYEEGARSKDGRLRFMVVIGNV